MITKQLKKNDFFAKIVELNIDGESEQSTLVGGICTNLIYLLVFMLMGLEVKKLVLNEGDSTLSINSIVDADKMPIVLFNETGYMFTLKLTTLDEDKDLKKEDFE